MNYDISSFFGERWLIPVPDGMYGNQISHFLQNDQNIVLYNLDCIK